MTIDEAIAKYKEITNTDSNCPRYCMNPCEECVKECEQLAEWLEELKANRIALEKANGYLETNYRLGYSKAIDDFASKLIMHFADWKLSNAPYNDDETDRIREIICETIENAICGVEEIAEQLKAGGENE